MEVWFRQTAPYYCSEDRPTPFPVPGYMWDRPRGEQLYAERMKFIRRLDELGFDGLIFTEHHSGPNGGLTPSPTVLLAAATQVTERIKLVTMGIMLALYPQPLRIAEELAMIDNLSHGRLQPGFISSTSQNLYAYNVPTAEERARYHEAYDLLIKAWTEPEPFEWHSTYYDYPCVSILPRPLQQPYPRTWTTAVSQESMEWAASKRMGFMSHGPTPECAQRLGFYRKYAEESCGWSPGPFDVAIAREMFVAPKKISAAELDEFIANTFENDPVHSFGFLERGDSPLRSIDGERRSVRSFDYLTVVEKPFFGAANDREGLRSGQFLAGDPDMLIEQITAQHKATGAGIMVVRNEVGPVDLGQALEGLELFAREVLPVVQKL
jgi:alkanesulfonate monooxygenase SsuD/methylene tetrahydromethanopterin reductase-like flavin-dependent oxidoreductase (luciferase family)